MKKIMKFSCILLTAMLVLSVVLVGYAKAEATPTQKTIGWPKFVTIATSPGGIKPVCISIASTIKKELGISSTITTGAGTLEYARLLAKNEVEFAMIAGSVFYEAYRGTGLFEEKLPVRQVSLFYLATLGLVTHADSGIKTVGDMRGKRVMCLNPGAPYVEVLTVNLLAANGMTMDDIIPLPVSGQPSADAEALRDGLCDVWVNPGSPGAPFFTELAMTTDVYFIPLTEAEIGYVLERVPYFAPGFYPAGSFRLMDKDVPCIANPMFFAVHRDMDDDFVYAIAKLLMDTCGVDTPGRFVKIHPDSGGFTLRRVIAKPSTAAFHPAAIKYYKERGVWTAELDKIQKEVLAEIGEER